MVTVWVDLLDYSWKLARNARFACFSCGNHGVTQAVMLSRVKVIASTTADSYTIREHHKNHLKDCHVIFLAIGDENNGVSYKVQAEQSTVDQLHLEQIKK